MVTLPIWVCLWSRECVVSIRTFLASVPIAVWSALAASLLTLGGVILSSVLTLTGVVISNRSNTNRLLRQLEHDASQKRSDRMTSLRKEVYLRGADEMATVGGRLADFPNIDTTKEVVGRAVAPFFSAMAQIQLISEPATARIASELSALVGEAIPTLMEKLLPVSDARIEADTAGVFYKKNQGEVERINAELRAMIETGAIESDRFKALERSRDNAQGIADKFFDDQQAASARRMRAFREYTIYLIRTLDPIAKHQIRLAAAIRGELGLETDIADFERRLEESRGKMEVLLGGLMNQLVSEIEDGP